MTETTPPGPAQQDKPQQDKPRTWPAVAAATLAVVCLVVAVMAGVGAHAALTRTPTAAERAAAAATAVARRWQAWPAGRIFPASLGYSTGLLTAEKATRIGISPASGCAAAVGAVLGPALRRDHCRAGLRATYQDQLQGIVYTIGVLAFPDSRHAAAFSASLAGRGAHFRALRPLALPGTASARFGVAATQRATARRGGPFVILTIAGYADGQPRGGQRRPSVFAPATQLAAQIVRPLTAPATVNCASPQWSC
jgi:hypothetical protein